MNCGNLRVIKFCGRKTMASIYFHLKQRFGKGALDVVSTFSAIKPEIFCCCVVQTSAIMLNSNKKWHRFYLSSDDNEQ